MYKNCILENWSESFFLCSFKNFQLFFLHLNPNPGFLGVHFQMTGGGKVTPPPVQEFNYWSKFHLNIITGSGVMTILFYKGLTRHPEIGYNPVWDLPNIWEQGIVRNTKFGDYQSCMNICYWESCFANRKVMIFCES